MKLQPTHSFDMNKSITHSPRGVKLHLCANSSTSTDSTIETLCTVYYSTSTNPIAQSSHHPTTFTFPLLTATITATRLSQSLSSQHDANKRQQDTPKNTLHKGNKNKHNPNSRKIEKESFISLPYYEQTNKKQKEAP